MGFDAKCKRAQYIDKTTTIRETFSDARPEEKLAAINVYAGGLYGFALWDLYSPAAESAFKCWDTAVKLSWECVPRSCHHRCHSKEHPLYLQGARPLRLAP